MRIWGLLVLMVALTFTARAADLKVGDQAPEINAKDWINTDAMSLAASSKKLVVVEFWATWCGPCRASIPHLVELNNKYKDKGVVIVGLSNEPIAKVKGFASNMKMSYIVGAGSTTGKEYGVSGIPHAFIVAPGGKIVWRGHPGGLEKALEAAMKTNPPQI